MLLIHNFSVSECLLYPPIAVDGSLLYPKSILYPDLSCQRQASHWLEKLRYAGLTSPAPLLMRYYKVPVRVSRREAEAEDHEDSTRRSRDPGRHVGAMPLR